MTEQVDQYRCAGCGVVLQTDSEHQPGYVPASALKRERIICQRCFKLTHYNEVMPIEMSDDHFRQLLASIGQTEGLVVKIVDIFDVDGSWISGIQRFVGKNPILLVANKVDLLPRNMNFNRLRNWLQQSAKENGLKPIDILFCSAKNNLNIEGLMEAIERYRSGHDVFIVGMTNVGKSSLINQILKQTGVDHEDLLTTSPFPGTTLNMIEIPLEDGHALYDTPGIVNRKQMVHHISTNELKVISPNKPIKPRVYQLNEGQTLFFGGLARLDFQQGQKQSFVCYVSNLLQIHRTKLEKADEIYRRHLGGMLQPPGDETMKRWKPLVKTTYKIGPQPTDIVFSGLGWVTLKGNGAVVEVHVPQGVSVSVRKALI